MFLPPFPDWDGIEQSRSFLVSFRKEDLLPILVGGPLAIDLLVFQIPFLAFRTAEEGRI